MKRVLVAGASGQTGRRCVALLVERGVGVRVLARDAGRARLLFAGVEVHEGDVRDPPSLSGLASGCDAALCAIGTRSYFGGNGGHAVDALGTRNLLAACGNLPHLVFLSAFGLDRRSWALSAFSLLFNHYYRWKAEAEDAVRQSGVPYTIVRPVELHNRRPRSAPLLNQEAPLSILRSVSRQLVAEVLVGCLGRPEAMGKTFELCEGGPVGIQAQLAALRLDGDRLLPPATPLWD
jgi:uncharacterized protein YbjT (DUF2867 family)